MFCTNDYTNSIIVIFYCEKNDRMSRIYLALDFGRILPARVATVVQCK